MCEQTAGGQDDTVEVPENSWPEPQEGVPWAEVGKERREECLGENTGQSTLGHPVGTGVSGWRSQQTAGTPDHALGSENQRACGGRAGQPAVGAWGWSVLTGPVDGTP